MILTEIAENLTKGKAKVVKEKVQEALDQGINAKQILDEGMLAAMAVIGEKFKNNEIFVPEVLIAARALNAGMAVLEPVLVEQGNEPVGRAVIGTVKGDLHDIGKNLVAMMLKGTGFEVIDLGVDVTADKFISSAEEVGADIICMSSLLTTTMTYMESVVEELEARGLRDKYTVMIGGAPVTNEFAKQIRADHYTPDAATASQVAKQIMQKVG
ncbi:MAG: corrinoid protein [Cellulosilyticaceae bacterium]